MRNKSRYNRKFHPAKILFFVVMGVAFAFALGAVVMFLWNAILPNAIGANTLNLWEAMGLLVLCRILFGGFHSKPWGRGNRRRKYWRKKWMNMNEEEKAAFKSKWKERCSRRNDDEGASKDEMV